MSGHARAAARALARLVPDLVFRVAAVALTLAVASLFLAGTALSHGGGAPRLTNAPAGPYGVYAWTEPEPLRQGQTHLTIGVTVQAESVVQGGRGEAAITDAVVNVTYAALDGSGVILEGQALAQERLGSVYYEADMEIPTDGPWQITIAVDGTEGSGETAFIADVAAPRRVRWMAVAAGCVLVVAAGAIVLNRLRAEDGSAPRSRPAGGLRSANRVGPGEPVGQEAVKP